MTLSQFNKRWHSPVNVYMHLDKLKEKIGRQSIENSPYWKRTREARIAAVIAFVLSRIRGLPTFIRLPLHDPPDAYLMQPNSGSMEIITVELTSYRSGAKETLLEQLARTKIKEYETLSSEYILAVELLTEDGVDYQAINNYAVKVKALFQIWSFRKIQDSPDTIAEVIVMNPEVSRFTVNVGEEANYYNDRYTVSPIIFSKKVTKPEDVRTETTNENCNVAPWEDLED